MEDGSKLFKTAIPETKILLPGEYKKKDRKELIDKFVDGWLTDKQIKGMKPWCVDMLDAFATELLIHTKMSGMDKFLLPTSAWDSLKIFNQDKRPKFSLPIVPAKPEKFKTDIEEIDGDLTSGVNLFPTKRKVEEDPDPVG